MSPRLFTAAFLLSLSVLATAQEAAAPEISRPLNLSLPRDAAWSSPVRPERTTLDGLHVNPIGLPDMGVATTGRAGRMPYGTGYEARQRNRTESGSGNASEMGRGHGGGGRMGRGR
jgi:hypothetical protein